MDFNSLIQLKRDRFDQLERDIADPALFSNRQRAKRHHARSCEHQATAGEMG